jgi:hypothetical protein
LLEASSIQTFTIEPTRSNGFFDLVLTRHDSASASEVRPYKFDGKEYREEGCYMTAREGLGSDGQWHRFKEPRVTQCGK